MHIHTIALFVAVTLSVCGAARAQKQSTSDKRTAALLHILNSLERSDRQEAAIKDAALEAKHLIARNDTQGFMQLLRGTGANSIGRGTLYEAMVDAKQYGLSDLTFLTELFLFAVEKNPTDRMGEAPRQRVPMTTQNFAVIVARRILVVLEQPDIVGDPDAKGLYREPLKWLKAKFERALGVAGSDERTASISEALAMLRESKVPDMLRNGLPLPKLQGMRGSPATAQADIATPTAVVSDVTVKTGQIPKFVEPKPEGKNWWRWVMILTAGLILLTTIRFVRPRPK